MVKVIAALKIAALLHLAVGEVPEEVEIDLLDLTSNTTTVAIGGSIIFKCPDSSQCSLIQDVECRYPLFRVNKISYDACNNDEIIDYSTNCPKDETRKFTITPKDDFTNNSVLYFVSHKNSDSLCTKEDARIAVTVIDYDCNPSLDCPAPPACREATCDFGTCGFKNIAFGTICTDDSYLTTDDRCDGGYCLGDREYNFKLVLGDVKTSAAVYPLSLENNGILGEINGDLDSKYHVDQNDCSAETVDGNVVVTFTTKARDAKPPDSKLEELAATMTSLVNRTINSALTQSYTIVDATVSTPDPSTTQTTTATTTETTTATSTPTTSTTTQEDNNNNNVIENNNNNNNNDNNNNDNNDGDNNTGDNNSGNNSDNNDSNNNDSNSDNNGDNTGTSNTGTSNNNVNDNNSDNNNNDAGTTTGVASNTGITTTVAIATTANPSNTSSSSSDDGVIAGIPLYAVIAAGAGLVLLIVLLCVCRCCCGKGKKPRPQPQTFENPSYGLPDYENPLANANGSGSGGAKLSPEDLEAAGEAPRIERTSTFASRQSMHRPEAEA